MNSVTEKEGIGEILARCFDERSGSYRDVLRLFTEAALRFVVFNLPIHYEMKRKPSDLDLLLDAESYAAAGLILESLGFVRLDRRPGPQQVVYAGFDRTHGFLRVHLHEQIVFLGLTLLTYESARMQTVMLSGIRVADPVLDFHLLNVQWFFKGKEDYLARIETVESLCDRKSLAAEGPRLFARHFRFAERLLRMRQSGVSPTPRRRVIEVMKYTGIDPGVCRSLWRKMSSRFDWLLLWRRRGLLVFLMGIDGTGKTTVAQQIKRQHDGGGLFCSYHYFGLKDTVVQKVRRAIRPRDSHERELGPSGIADGLARISGSLANLFNVVLTPFYLVEYLLRSVFLLGPIRRQNDVIIVDRTYLDRLMDLQRWGNKLFFHLLPRPDFVVALGGDPEVLYERKGEFEIPVLMAMQKKMDRALIFLEKHSTEVLRLDTTQVDETSTVAAIQSEIWSRVTGRRVK